MSENHTDIFWIDEKGSKINSNGFVQTDVSQTHTTTIYNLILKKHNLPQITQKSYNQNGIPHMEGVQGMKRKVLENKMDAREYAIKEWDWIRVSFYFPLSGKNLIQLKNLTPSVKERLLLHVPDGTYDIESINKFYPQTRIDELIN